VQVQPQASELLQLRELMYILLGNKGRRHLELRQKTNNKLLYIGEATKLVKRLRQEHSSIKNWNYYRYHALPNTINSEQRLMLERMLIRDFASLMESKSDIYQINISEYRLTNEKIDSR